MHPRLPPHTLKRNTTHHHVDQTTCRLTTYLLGKAPRHRQTKNPFSTPQRNMPAHALHKPTMLTHSHPMPIRQLLRTRASTDGPCLKSSRTLGFVSQQHSKPPNHPNAVYTKPEIIQTRSTPPLLTLQLHQSAPMHMRTHPFQSPNCQAPIPPKHISLHLGAYFLRKTARRDHARNAFPTNPPNAA